MADVQPLRALRYDLGKAGPLDRLTAPPYDVIDVQARAELASRSPYNVVAVDLPQGDDPYAAAGALWNEWQKQGVVVRDAEPALWALTQSYRTPDGATRVRSGFFCRVRLTPYGPGLVRPHERTHPAAKEDRLRLMRATHANLSPIFALYADPERLAWSAIEEATRTEPWGEVTDADGTTHRLWRVADGATIERVREVLADRELLIADGHHRYETARTYADEVGGEGDHRYVLMCLVSLSDPGLTILPTHRLVRGIDGDRRQHLARMLERDFHVREVAPAELAPDPASNGDRPVYGYLEAGNDRALRLELASPELAERALAQHSAPYRRLDTAVLEKLVLEQALGLSGEDISHGRGLAYASDVGETIALIERKEYDVAFLLRPTPVEQVRAVAEAGETMPPKSTYFYPKLLSGLLFNPL
jgi:uncharacterized protein (DUF1015 family)